jgi:hypothetical protein
MMFFRKLFKQGPNVQSVQEDIPAPTPQDKIRAFNSIVSILAQIQQGEPFKDDEIPSPNPPDGSERLQLKLSNAFANLAVADVEIVAATLYTPEELSILTWMQDQEVNDWDKPEAAQDTQEPSFWKKICWLFATNTNISDLKPGSSYEGPRIVRATPPPGYPTASDSRTNMLEYLEEFPNDWTPLKESSHLWVLANILVTLNSDSQLLFHFMKYVIAASHPKIRRRFGTPSSREYLRCFKSMKPEEIHFSAASAQRETLQNELQNDDKFLKLLQMRDTVIPNYKTKYPNIATSALKGPLHLATASNSELFNAATCKEYHLLFKRLMTKYQKTVDKIDGLKKKRAPFKNELDFAVKTGHMLLTMVKGRAFHLYLLTVAPILSRRLSELRQIASEGCHAEENDAEESEAEGSEVEESEAEKIKAEESEAEPGTTLWDPVKADTSTMGLWKPFKSWIMLMLVQLDAADALCGFVQKVELSQAEIDVKLVYSPLVSYNTIPLEELLQAGHIREPDGDEKTNAELLDFVKMANVRKKQLKDLAGFQKKWDAKRASAAKKFIGQVLDQTKKEDQEDSNQRNGGVTPISALCEQINELLSQQPGDSQSILAKLTALAEELEEGQALPFNENPTFKGTLHCELGLASILDKSTRDAIRARIDQLKVADSRTHKDENLYHSLSELLEETKKFKRVIGVSKRCCPVCRRFLAYLSLDGKPNTSIVVSGFHNTISSCTLPEWTPEFLVDRMNITFGQLLRKELAKLSREVILQKYRSRRQSTGSGVSVGSSYAVVGNLE